MILSGYLAVLVLLAGLGSGHGLAVMSVDLGSEWMKIAVVSPGVPMEIVLNPESKRKTAAAVSLMGGERKFGGDAMNVCVKSPKNCYTYLVDLLGKKVDNPIVQLYKQRFPHHIIKPSDRGTVEFETADGTVYSVEELLGMIFSHAKQQAETYAEQKIKDAVITTPVYFNQAERAALINAVKLGGLNVLQLMSEPMAVALNYGMFRRKEINGTTRHMMLYDMGAQDTTVSIVAYQIVKTKEKGFTETHPQAQILGIGYDRTLGGADITFKLREFLADEFDALKKTKTKVRSVPRAMGKLLKEAERVKLILSANTDCFAQVENVMEDIDFKVAVSRDQLYSLIDSWDRVNKPVQQALDAAAITMDLIDQVILVGGGSRVPKVQELLAGFVGRELGKNLNTDESAAMGAVYKAADLSTGFKVKKFITKEAVVFPLDVNFERELQEGEEGGENGLKKVRRTLFSRMNPFPQKKIMTFNKHVKDFTFVVNYADVEYLGETEVSYLGEQQVASVEVQGVAGALDANKGDNIETKGVKAHFTLDESGILTCTLIESVFEKTISVAEQEQKAAEEEKEKDDTWSKLGDTISQFFTSEDADKDAADKSSDKKDGKSTEKKSDAKKDAKKDEKKDGKKDKKESDKKEKKKEPLKPKVETVRQDLAMVEERRDVPLLSAEGLSASQAKLEVLDKADRDRVARETALNELQSFVYDLQEKLYEDAYESASTEEEREKMRSECSTVSDWLDEEAGVDTPIKEFNTRMKQLREISSSLFARVREHRERPEALDLLQKSVDGSKEFLDKSKNLTGEDGFFKEKELEVLEKKLNETVTWQTEKVAEQDALPLHEMPKLTVNLIQQKVSELDSEVKYLVQKAKMVKAERERARRLKEAEDKKAAEEAERAARKAAKKAKKEAEAAGAAEEGSGGGEEATDSEDSTDKKPEDAKVTAEDTVESPEDATASEPASDTLDKDEPDSEKEQEEKDPTESDHTEL